MHSITNETQQLLIDSFKQLMLEYPFQKITIKMITDGAGVIRPTFYNHFRDKYEMFEVILDDELFNSLHDLVNINMTKEANKMIFTYFNQHRSFYEKAFEVRGQNAFRDILTKKITDLLSELVNYEHTHPVEEASLLNKDQLLRFTAMNTVIVLEMWILDDKLHKIDGNQIYEAFNFLMKHNVEDFFE